jgi:hypothetical protein
MRLSCGPTLGMARPCAQDNRAHLLLQQRHKVVDGHAEPRELSLEHCLELLLELQMQVMPLEPILLAVLKGVAMLHRDGVRLLVSSILRYQEHRAHLQEEAIDKRTPFRTR